MHNNSPNSTRHTSADEHHVSGLQYTWYEYITMRHTPQCTTCILKLTFMQYPAIHITLHELHYIPHHHFYNIIIFDTALRQKGNLEHEK